MLSFRNVEKIAYFAIDSLSMCFLKAFETSYIMV